MIHHRKLCRESDLPFALTAGQRGVTALATPLLGMGLPVENWDNGESRVGTDSSALAGCGTKCE
jgi:hypothetical protein